MSDSAKKGLPPRYPIHQLLTQSLLDLGLTVEQAYRITAAIGLTVNSDPPLNSMNDCFAAISAHLRQEDSVDLFWQKRPAEISPPFSQDHILNLLESLLLTSGVYSNDVNFVRNNVQNLVETAQKIQHRNHPDSLASISQKYDRWQNRKELVLNRLNQAHKPIVLYIGGATGSGKSTVAAEIGYQLNITKIISTDSIREVMRSIFSKGMIPSIHHSSYEVFRQPAFVTPGEDANLRAFLEQAMHVGVGIQALTERNILENVNMIVDGVHLVPNGIEPINRGDGLLIHVLLAVKDEQNHKERFKRRERRAKDRPAKRYLQNFEAIRKIQDHLIAMAEQHHIPVFDNENVEDAVTAILDHILSQLTTSSDCL